MIPGTADLNHDEIVAPFVGLETVNENVVPLHLSGIEIRFNTGLGFTVIENVFAGPVQVVVPEVNTGVTVIVAVTELLFVFTTR